MSRDDRDKAGGHADRKRDVRSCGCCPSLPPAERSRSRARRNRALDKFQRSADVA
jgi:hypothetical protein